MGYRTHLNLRIYGDDVILDGNTYSSYIMLLHNYSINKIYMEDIMPRYDEIDPDKFGYIFFYDEGYSRGELTVETFINIFNYSKAQRPEEPVNVDTTWGDVCNTLEYVYIKLIQWLDAGLITHDHYIEFEVF